MKKLVFALAIVLLLVNFISIVYLESTTEPISFTELLIKVQNAPVPINLDLQASLNLLKVNADWGSWNFLITGINGITSVLGFVIWLCSSMINVLYQIGYYFYVLGLSSGYFA